MNSVSFEQLLSVAQFRQLARAGGAAVMTTRVRPGNPETAPYFTIGDGSVRSADGRVVLMTKVLQQHDVRVCLAAGPFSQVLSPARVLASGSRGTSNCHIGFVPRGNSTASFSSDVSANVARAIRGKDVVLVLDFLNLRVGEASDVGEPEGGTRGRDDLLAAGELVSQVVRAVDGRRMLVMVLAAAPSKEMNRVGDEVTPLVAAQGEARNLFPSTGPLRGLRSDTTRQLGLVSNVDVAPSILDFFGVPVPAEMEGTPIRFTTAEAPFDLHRRHLEHRRIRFPIQIAEVTFVSLAGLVAIIALLVHAKRPLPPRAAAALRFLALCGLALPIAVLGGGALPRLTYAYVVPFLVLSVLLVAGLSLVAGPGRTMWPVVFIGVLGLSLAVLDAALGGHALRMPLLGGTMFDGVRFYGLPNAFIALVLAGALIAAAPLYPIPGTLVVAAAGLFAGFPQLGANIGASITLFAAAGLWWGLRTRRRLGSRELFVAAAFTLVGLAVVLLANAWLTAVPTHATRLVERTGGGLGGAWEVIADRLAIGFRQLMDAPAALIPLVGLIGVLAVVLREPGRIGAALRRHEAWRDALVVLTLSSIVAYFVNDTGLAAAAPGFLYAMSVLTYLAFLPQPQSQAQAFMAWLEEGALAR